MTDQLDGWQMLELSESDYIDSDEEAVDVLVRELNKRGAVSIAVISAEKFSHDSEYGEKDASFSIDVAYLSGRGNREKKWKKLDFHFFGYPWDSIIQELNNKGAVAFGLLFDHADTESEAEDYTPAIKVVYLS